MKSSSFNLKSEPHNCRLDSQRCSTFCARCHGLMVRVRFMDMLDSGSLWGLGWRCVNCGSIVDTVIRTNQGPDRPPEMPRKAKRRRMKRLIAA